MNVFIMQLTRGVVMRTTENAVLVVDGHKKNSTVAPTLIFLTINFHQQAENRSSRSIIT